MIGSGSLPATSSALGCVLHGWDWVVSARVNGIMHGPRGLILDLDDTLYPLEHFVQSGLMAVARHLQEQRGVPAVDAFVTMATARREAQRGRELQVVCARYGLSTSMVPSLLQILRAHRPALRLPTTTAAVLSRLRADGWRLAVLTNGDPSIQRAKVDALGLSSLVRDVVYADEHALGGKPSPDTFRAALGRLDLPVDRVVMVGDDPACDIAGARAVGLKSIRLATTGRRPLLPEGDAVIDSLESLPAVAAALLETVTVHAA